MPHTYFSTDAENATEKSATLKSAILRGGKTTRLC